jgi:Ca2+-binding EF-hand superfamily protein
MDDDGSGALNRDEFKSGMKDLNVDFSDGDYRVLFDHFDADNSGSVSFEEFIQGVRDPMKEDRQKLVRMAFSILDQDGSGIVNASEIAEMYDPSMHPDVISKKKRPEEVLREFLDTFDVGGVKDGEVTQEEFINYYANLSASIDNDQYFELMMRNAWHIAGGEGAATNSSNLRVKVTDSQGYEKVVTLMNDLGLKQGDVNGMYKHLTAQGVTDICMINGKSRIYPPVLSYPLYTL